MTYRGHIKNGQVTLDEPVQFPEGATVTVTLIDTPEPNDDGLAAMLLHHAGKGKDLPSDLAQQHDHYAHGKPKR
jgi:hypothetical protein